jgi:hypothetical protein
VSSTMAASLQSDKIRMFSGIRSLHHSPLSGSEGMLV